MICTGNLKVDTRKIQPHGTESYLLADESKVASTRSI